MRFLLCTFLFLASHLPAEEPSQDYDLEFVQLVEMIYGEGLLSQGGIHSIDEMFSDTSLEGIKALDLGSGLGMYDLYLAKHHRIDITAIDPQAFLIEKAKANLESAPDLLGSVSFSLMQNPSNLSQFEDHSFDLIFSKEAILHVPLEIKQAYFHEIYRVLKPGGKIVIMDWIRHELPYSDSTRRMMEMDGVVFQLQTAQDYQSTLKTAGFDEIALKDTTAEHALLSQQNVDTIRAKESEIKTRFGEKTYHYSEESWTLQRDAFRSRELVTGVFTARKPS